MRKLELNILQNGLPGISKAMGAFLAEAAMVCLEKNGHRSGVELIVKGDFQEAFEVVWSDKVDTIIEGTWNDLKEVTEFGATGLALLLISKLTEFQIFERSKGDSFDFYLKKSQLNNLQAGIEENLALLEISGIFKEKKGNTVNMRVNIKKKQLQNIPFDFELYIVVTEFSVPKAKIIKNG